MAVGRETDNDLILAIDQGAQNTRVAVYTRQGDCVLSHTVSCPPTFFIDGRVEQVPEEVLGSLRDSLLHVAQLLGPRCRRLVAVGFSGQGGAVMAWDTETGDPLSPVICEKDVRAGSLHDYRQLSAVSVKTETGLLLSPHSGANKMQWCMEQIPLVRRAAEQSTLMIGPLAAYLFSELLETENCSISPDHAQRTSLWSIVSNDWNAGLLSAFHLKRSWLPVCAKHDSCYGHLPLGGARLPLVSVHCEQNAALFARGVPAPEVCYMDIGDNAIVQRINDESVTPDTMERVPVWLPESDRSAPIYLWVVRVDDISTLDTETLVFKLADCYHLMAERLGAAQKIMSRNARSGIDGISQSLANLTSTAVHNTGDPDAELKGVAYTAAGMPEQWPSGAFGPIFHPLTDDGLNARFNQWLENRARPTSH